MKVNKLMLAKATSWTLNHIEDELDWRDFHESLEILDAVDKAHAYKQDKAAWQAQGRKGRR